MYGRRITTTNATHFEIMSTCMSLTKRVKYHRRLLEQFTNRWRKDYLLSLREHHSMKHQGTQDPCIKVGDVVLLYDEGTKRVFWKLAVVNELIQGSDDKVRAAVIRVGSDKGPAKLFKRSIQHLIPIEVTRDDTAEETEVTPTDNLVETPSRSDSSEMTPEVTTRSRPCCYLW